MRILKISRKHKGSHLSLYNVTYETHGIEYNHETVSRRGTTWDPTPLDVMNIGQDIDGVTCIVLNKNHDSICLIQEYRPAANAWVCDIPMGLIEHHETPKQAAIRETIEETGLTDLKVLNVLKPVYVNPSYSDSRVVTVVLETDDTPAFNENHIVPLWFEIKKLKRLLLHRNCPPMSSKAQSVLYSLAMAPDIDFLISPNQDESE